MPHPMTPTQRLDRVSQDAMCIGCGLCQSLAGPEVLRMEVVENGTERPVVHGTLTHEMVDRIFDVCPGTRIEGLPDSLTTATTQTDLIWGPYVRMTLAHASDPDVRHRGSTGGVLTALGLFLLQSGEVECVLHARASARHPGFGGATVSETAQDVLQAAGSRYGPTAPLTGVHELLDTGRRFAFIGKPCDIAALRNLARIDARVDKLVPYMMTPVCGGFMPPEGLERFLQRSAGLATSDLRSLRYRGFGCPGPTRAETHDGTVHTWSYSEFWGTDASMWMLPFRCKVGPDGIGEAADIAASDTWPGGSPDPDSAEDDPGTNALIMRTDRGAALVERAVTAGYLTCSSDVGPRYMDQVQPHQRAKKLCAGSRHNGLRGEGWTVPRTARLRLDALTDALGAVDAARQSDGTRQRLRDGKATEAAPRARKP